MRLFSIVCGIMALLLNVIASNGSCENLVISTGEWSPFISESLPGGGPVTQIVTAAFAAEGVKVTYKYVPWKRAIKMVKDGKALGSSAWSDTPERRAFALPSNPLVSSREVFVFMKKNLPGFDYTNLEDLKKYKVASLAGYSHEKAFQKAGLVTDSTYDAKTALIKLEKGRVDLMCENEAVVANLIRKTFPGRESEFGLSKTAFNEQPLHLLISKQFPGGEGYLKRFNAGIKKIQKDGTYEKIANQLK